MKSEDAAFSALDPFFELIRGCLTAHLDADPYFDTIAEMRSSSSVATFRDGLGESRVAIP
jgi:hypothetical protein